MNGGERPAATRGGIMPRYLTLIHVDEQNPPVGDPAPADAERMGALFEEITRAGAPGPG
jgi:hypothetical protein